MAYIPNTKEDTTAMLDAIGVGSVEDLFSDIPEKVRLAAAPKELPAALSEYETLRLMGRRAAMNNPAGSAYLNFIGAGSYEHFIPSAVQAIAQRGEILTAYTPYQAEASQGTLQIVYEFQSMICSLTGLDVSNASMYDGASSLAEAVLMAIRINNRHQVVLPETLHPNYRDAVKSYTHQIGVELIPWRAKDGLTDVGAWPEAAAEPAAVVIQYPNFFGYVEEAAKLAAMAKERGAVVIAVANPMALSVLEPPGAWDADICAGEAQPVGLPMNFGGPYAGYLATREEHIRKMPGRIVGRTVDEEGKPAFVLTLQTREQHIRRERATSNICTNQGLCATMVTVYLSLIGKSGFEQLGEVNLERAGRLHEALTHLPGVSALSSAPFFNEFTVRLPMKAEQFSHAMRAEGILAGLPATRLGNADPNLLIVCATETKSDEDLDRYAAAARAVLGRFNG
jgi:glycine dehydrogenase subunit 1